MRAKRGQTFYAHLVRSNKGQFSLCRMLSHPCTWYTNSFETLLWFASIYACGKLCLSISIARNPYQILFSCRGTLLTFFFLLPPHFSSFVLSLPDHFPFVFILVFLKITDHYILHYCFFLSNVQCKHFTISQNIKLLQAFCPTQTYWPIMMRQFRITCYPMYSKFE